MALHRNGQVCKIKKEFKDCGTIFARPERNPEELAAPEDKAARGVLGTVCRLGRKLVVDGTSRQEGCKRQEAWGSPIWVFPKIRGPSIEANQVGSSLKRLPKKGP